MAAALVECDALVVTGGSSVGDRDRLPEAVAALGSPRASIVHGLRVKPGKPTLLGAVGAKPILGLPGNPMSALMMLEAVGAPLFAALAGAPLRAASIAARLAAPLRGRAGMDVVRAGGTSAMMAGTRWRIHSPCARSRSSLLARADGYLVMGEA